MFYSSGSQFRVTIIHDSRPLAVLVSNGRPSVIFVSNGRSLAQLVSNSDTPQLTVFFSDGLSLAVLFTLLVATTIDVLWPGINQIFNPILAPYKALLQVDQEKTTLLYLQKSAFMNVNLIIMILNTYIYVTNIKVSGKLC